MICRKPAHRARCASFPSVALVAVAILLLGQSARAADGSWTGSTNSSWTTTSNWLGGIVPGANDVAKFDSNFTGTNQPAPSDNTVGALWLTGVTKSVTITIASSKSFTLNAGTSTVASDLGIRLDDTASHFTMTIAGSNSASKLLLGANQRWLNNVDSSVTGLTVSSKLDTNGKALTIDGTGKTLISGDISGSGSLTKTGSGTLLFSGNNNFTGGITIQQGTLSVSAAMNLGGANNGIKMDGGTLQLNGLSTGTGRTFTITGNGGTFDSASGTNNITGSITNGTGAGASTVLNKIGSVQLTLTGDNSGYTGQWNVTAGNLAIGAANSINSSNAVTLSSTGGFRVGAFTTTIGNLNGSGSGTIQTNASGTGTLVVTQTTDGSVSNVVTDGTGVLNFTKAGSAKLTLTGNNTYTGTTAVNAGTLEINNTGTTGKLGGTSGITVNSGGTLLLSGSSSVTDRINNSATLTLSGGTFKTGGLSEGAAGTTGIGALTLTSTSTIDFGVTNISVIQFAGVGSQTGILQITNWNGNTGTGGSGDRLLFAGNATDFTSLYSQSEVVFNGNAAGYNIFQFSGFYEVTAVPEPGTWFGAGLALLAVLYSQRHRLLRLRRLKV